MADQTANLRVRISADLNDIKQGLGLVQRQVEAFKKSAAAPLPSKNPISQVGKDGVETSKVLAALQPQITDIITSLQGGMPFTTVLLQQGGQIRDMAGQMGFGFRDVGKALLSLVNPYTVAAAAVGVLALAWYKADQEQQAFQAALIKTGSYAGDLGGKLGDLADDLDDLDGVTHGGAVEALTAVAASGQIAADQFQKVSAATAAWSAASGESVDSVVAKFALIAKDPVDGLLKLNEAEHFLTEAQLERVRALVEEGNQQAAVAEGINIYSDTLADRTQDILGNLSNITGALNGFKDAFSGAMSWLGGFADYLLGVSNRAQAAMVVLGKQALTVDPKYGGLLNTPWSATLDYIKYGDGKAPQSGKGPASPTVDSEDERKKQDFVKGTNQLLGQTLDLEGRIKQMRADAAKEGITDAKLLQQREDALRAIDAKAKAKSAGGIASADRSAALQGYKDSLAQEQASLKADTDALKRQYDARTITVEDYYTQLAALTQKGNDAQAGALEKQIAYLKQQSVTGKDAISVNAQIAQLEAQLAIVRTNGASAQKALADEESAAVKARQAAIDSYTAALQASNVALGRQLQTMVDKVGMGDREYEIQQRINDAYADEADKLLDLQAQLNANQIDQVKFDAERTALHQKTIERLDLIKSKYADLAAAESNWQNGAAAAWSNYAQQTANIAGQVQDAVTSAFSGMEDALVTFATTGKLSFTDLANSIIKDLARIAAKQLITGLVGNLFGNLAAGVAGTRTTAAAQSSGNYGAFNPQFGWQYATGGYTGPGGVFEPAGIVHKGEGVLSQRDIAAIGGPSGFMAMLASIRSARGYAEGGYVGHAASLAAPRLAMPEVKVTINKGATEDRVETASSGTGGLDIQVFVKTQVNSVIASGGADKSMQQRYGIGPKGVRRG
jgi:lambda family phage tail tape measure protein